MKLEFNQVVKKYDGFQLNCTMTVEEGCVTGLIGRNGAGKSTALRQRWDSSVWMAAALL